MWCTVPVFGSKDSKKILDWGDGDLGRGSVTKHSKMKMKDER